MPLPAEPFECDSFACQAERSTRREEQGHELPFVVAYG